MKSQQRNGLARSAKITVTMIVALSGCATAPLEQKYTAGELRSKMKRPMPQCVKEQCKLSSDGAIQCWTYEPVMHMIKDGETCEREYHAWHASISEWRLALARRYDMDAATAPACIRSHTVSRRFFEIAEVDPDATDAMAQALARSGFVPFQDAQCMEEICRWRTQVEPREKSPYCEVVLNSLAGHNLNVELNRSGPAP